MMASLVYLLMCVDYMVLTHAHSRHTHPQDGHNTHMSHMLTCAHTLHTSAVSFTTDNNEMVAAKKINMITCLEKEYCFSEKLVLHH